MSEKHFKVNYGNGVTVFPEKAVEQILVGAASQSEIRVLALVLKASGDISSEDIARETGLSEQDTVSAVAFWRGTGIISFKDGKTKASVEKNDTHSPSCRSSEESSSVAQETHATESKVEASDPKTEDIRSTVPKKALLSAEMPKYSGQEISALLEKDGGRLKNTVDECQQLIGHIFNPRETEITVGLCDWLGVDSDFLITLTAYYTRKKPGCNVRYIEKAALDLVNNGVDTMELLDAHIRDLELYDGLAGKLRGWLGIGERTYTKKENATINHWIKDLGYGEELVRYAYEITVEHKTSFSFAYANKILENWFKEGVKTLDDAQAREQAYKNEKASATETDGKSSFNTDEFFDLALKRSYEKMALGKSKGDS